MYRLISWSFNIVLFYQAIIHHRLGFLIGGIVVLVLMVVAAPALMSIGEDDVEKIPPPV